MPYIDSYVWRIRQKIGHDLLVVPGVDIIAAREDGKILMVYNKEFDTWVFPGGCVEPDATWQENAARELQEEAGLIIKPDDLIPILATSASTAHYKNGDITKIFSLTFLAKKFIETKDKLDEAEIREKRWFSLNEVQKNAQNDDYQLNSFTGLKKYLATGEFQMITIDDEEEK